MKQLTKSEQKEVLGGAASGALFSGIAKIIDSGTNFITHIAEDVIGATWLFTKGSEHDKLKFKMGEINIDYDDTASHKAQIENKHETNPEMMIF